MWGITMKNSIDIKKHESKKIMSENLIKIVSKGADIRTISISDIIKDSGVSRSNFYNYFSDIYALLMWTYDQELTLQFDDMYHVGMHREALKYMYHKIYSKRNFYLNIYIYDKEHSVDKYFESLIFDTYCSQERLRKYDINGNRWFGSNLAGKAVSNVFGFTLREWMDSSFTISTEDIIDFSTFIRNVNLHDVFKGHR